MSYSFFMACCAGHATSIQRCVIKWPAATILLEENHISPRHNGGQSPFQVCLFTVDIILFWDGRGLYTYYCQGDTSTRLPEKNKFINNIRVLKGKSISITDSFNGQSSCSNEEAKHNTERIKMDSIEPAARDA